MTAKPLPQYRPAAIPKFRTFIPKARRELEKMRNAVERYLNRGPLRMKNLSRLSFPILIPTLVPHVPAMTCIAKSYTKFMPKQSLSGWKGGKLDGGRPTQMTSRGG